MTSCHTQLFIHKPYQARKPGFASRERPKPSEACKTGSGFKFDRPEASKSWAADPAFRPSRARKSLRLLLENGANVNVKDNQGRTPFQIANALMGVSNIKQLLSEHGGV